MGQVCTICSHPDRLEIDRQIVKGTPHLKIGKTFGLNNVSVGNHARDHLSRQMVKANELSEKLAIDTLLNEVEECLSRAKSIRDDPKYQTSPNLQLQAGRDIIRIIGMLASWGIEHQKLLLMANEQGQNPNGQQTVVVLPRKIDPSMSPQEAGQIYTNFLKTIREHPGADFQEAEVLPDQQQEQPDDNRPMIRKRRPSSSERVKQSVMSADPDQELSPPADQTPATSDEQEEDDAYSGMIGPDILNWQPDIPKKRSVWG